VFSSIAVSGFGSTAYECELHWALDLYHRLTIFKAALILSAVGAKMVNDLTPVFRVISLPMVRVFT